MYQMWRAGVSLVAWYLIEDSGLSDSVGQSGLYFGREDAERGPKPAMAAFRFPFVGGIVNGKISVWGRTPWGKPGRVLIEESQGAGWRRLGIVLTNGYGIFTKTFGAPRDKYVRARVLGKGGLAAPRFPLAGPRPLDIQGLKPFGSHP
jgi:hypothetical protein